MFILSKLLGWLLTPSNLLVVLVFLACLRRPRNDRRNRGALALAALLLVTGTLPVDEILIRPLEDRFPRPAEPPPHVDGIIVLGGAIDTDIAEARRVVAVNDHAERLMAAVALARRYPEARIVHTGGTSAVLPGSATEAQVADRWFKEAGIAPDRIVLEDLSRNTRENAVFSKQLVKPQPAQVWLLVTSAAHMPRSVGIFRRVGWTVVPWPVDYETGPTLDMSLSRSVADRLNVVDDAIHEWVGLGYYYLRGWTPSLFPAP
jgi:uncharacterized SAM-binding protein YcdF (DUF218 family)